MHCPIRPAVERELACPTRRVVAGEKRGEAPRYWPLAAVVQGVGFPTHWVVERELARPMPLVAVVEAFVRPTR